MTQRKILVVVGSLLLSAACGSRNAGPPDDALTNDIKAKLYSDATTRGAAINVAVKDGAVTLSGDVPSSDVELQAMKLANGTTGIRGVTDQLKVNSASAPANGPGPMPDAGGAPTGAAAPPPPPPPGNAPVNTASAPPPAPVRPETAAPSEPPAPVPAPRHREPRTVSIPAGTNVSVRMIDGIDSKQNEAGQVFKASLENPLVSGNRVIAQAGSSASVILSDVSKAGRLKGRSGLEVRLSRVDIGGESYAVNSSVVDQQGSARGKQTAIRTGIGAAAGAIIGGLAGGGKGAAIGSAAGGGAGFGYNVFTHGSQVKIPSETVLSFRLEAPITVNR